MSNCIEWKATKLNRSLTSTKTNWTNSNLKYYIKVLESSGWWEKVLECWERVLDDQKRGCQDDHRQGVRNGVPMCWRSGVSYVYYSNHQHQLIIVLNFDLFYWKILPTWILCMLAHLVDCLQYHMNREQGNNGWSCLEVCVTVIQDYSMKTGPH